MKKIIFIILFISVYNLQAQQYKSYTYLALQRNFGSIENAYTNAQKDNFSEKIGITMLEWGAEGMDRNFFVSFKTHFFGVIPDYIIRAMNKNNRGLIYGESLDNFYDEYNKVQKQYDYNASFVDFDVLGGNISYGYKYVFAGVNFAWAATTLKAYESVSNTKIKQQTPPNFYSFNTDGNFTYGLNIVFHNGNPEKPIRLICAYDWMLMRDYYNKWHSDLGNRLNFDLQANLPWKINKDKWGLYVGAIYRTHNITYGLPNVNSSETQKFTSSIFSLRMGINW